MITTILLTIHHKKPIADLTDKVAGRTYTLDGVDDVTATIAGWMPIESAPKDGTEIIAWCDHEADDFLDVDDHLTTYASRCEGLGHVPNGIHVIIWEEGQEITDGWENPSYWMPGGWVHNADPEQMANPTHYMHLPQPPKEQQ